MMTPICPDAVLDELVKSPESSFWVIPVPHEARDKLQPESSLSNGLWTVWTPVFTGVTTFYETIILGSALEIAQRSLKEKEGEKIAKLLHIIDSISEWSGKMVSWLVLILTAILGYEILMRYAFNAPTKWSFDLSYMIGGSYFILGEAYTLLKKRHVRIDIFYGRFSARKKALVDVIFYLIFFFPLWGGLLYALIPYVYLAWETGERSMQGYWMPILYPFKTVMPVAVFLFLLQGIAEFIRSVLTVARGGAS